MALDALAMGLWTRDRAGQPTEGVIAHSDKGVQDAAIGHTQRPAEAGAIASVGSTRDSYDNAMAEVFNPISKAELVRNRGPWKNIDDLDIAVAVDIDWDNHRRQPRPDRPRPTPQVREHLLRPEPASINVRDVRPEPPPNPARDSSCS